MILYIVIFIIASTISYFFTKIIRLVAIKKNILDIPNQRSSHNIPTPRGGGLSFFVVWLLILIILFLTNRIPKNLFIGLLSVIPIGLISIIDDIKNLSPKIRLLVHFISSLVAIYFVSNIGFENIVTFLLSKELLIMGFYIFLFIWNINLFNFLDGIDAYASLEAILVSIGLFLISNEILFILFIAPISGFLCWNWPKAKIFMGDVGSTMLGFTLIVFCLYYWKAEQINIFYWLSLTSLFWFDASITLIRRLINNEKISQPHKKHAYQRIVQSGFTHKKTAIVTILLNFILILVVYINHNYIDMAPYISFIFSLLMNSIIYYLIERKYSYHK